MQIKIDKKIIDFSLEEEKTADSVVSALAGWILQQNYYINDIEINRVKYNLNREAMDKLKKIPVEKIETVDIKTISILDLRYSQLEIIQIFFTDIARLTKEKKHQDILEYLKNYSDIKIFLESAIDRIYNSGNEGYIESFIEAEDFSDESLGKLRSFCESIIVIADSRKREISSAEEEIMQEYEVFKTISPDLGTISILLQTGKDREAMEKVLQFTDFSRKLLRLFSYYSIKKGNIIDNKKIESFNMMLSDLCDAISKSDSVLTGDILEYELAPAIETFFDLILKKSDSGE